MKILSLDISTKTGFAVIDSEDHKIIEHGLIRPAHTVEQLGEYPRSYVAMAMELATGLCSLIDRVAPDVIVVEETNPGGRAGRYSQKMLEYLHCAFLITLPVKHTIKYISTSVWRRTLQMKLSKDDKKNNSLVNAAKRSSKESGVSIYEQKAKLKVKGKVTWKHLSVRYVNEKYGTAFLMKDNDVTDAVCMALAFLAGAPACYGMD